MWAGGQDTHLSGRVIESQEVLLAPYGDADCKDRSGGGERSSDYPGSGALSLPTRTRSVNPSGGARRSREMSPSSLVSGSAWGGGGPGRAVAPAAHPWPRLARRCPERSPRGLGAVAGRPWEGQGGRPSASGAREARGAGSGRGGRRRGEGSPRRAPRGPGVRPGGGARPGGGSALGGGGEGAPPKLLQSSRPGSGPLVSSSASPA